MYEASIIERARVLRLQGSRFTEIQRVLGIKIPKSTLSYWCKNIVLSPEYLESEKNEAKERLVSARALSLLKRQNNREEKVDELLCKYGHMNGLLKEKDVALLILAALYWAEGGKHLKGSTCFANSDPSMIKLYLRLLEQCFVIQSEKFRVTIMCRADQNTKEIEKYWAGITGIQTCQFYKTRIDKRTIGSQPLGLTIRGYVG